MHPPPAGLPDGRVRSRASVAAFALAFALLTMACSEGDGAGRGDGLQPFGRGGTLRFSAIPDTRGGDLEQRFDRVADHLAGELGVAVEYVPSPDYDASVEAFVNGDIQAAWFGGLTGVQARRRVGGSRAIVQGASDPAYFSYFIAHDSTGIPEWTPEVGDVPLPADALRDRTFAFASPRSTSGRLMPEHFIRQATGEAPRDLFEGLPGFLDTHDNVVRQVAAGAYQVGAVNYKVFDRMEAAGEAKGARIVWRTPRYADYNLSVRGDFDGVFGAGSTDALKRALVALDDPSLLSAFDREDLIPARNADYAAIADVARKLDFIE